MRVLRNVMLSLAAGACAHAASPGSPAAPTESGDLLSPTAFANTSAATEETEARSLVQKLEAHDDPGASADFDAALKGTLPPDKLASTWAQFEGQWGSLVTIEDVHGQPYAKGWAVLVTCRFDKGVHTLSIFFDPNGQVSGIWNSPGIGAANMFVDALGYHHPELADALSDETMHDSMPTATLEKMWEDVQSRFGTYRGIREVVDKGTFALVTVAFDHHEPVFKVSVDERGKVTGFQLVEK